MKLDLPLILGSSSSFRRRILTENGYKFEVIKPDIDEKAIMPDDHNGTRAESNPGQLVMAICEAKAKAILEKVKGRNCVIITCDQVINYQGTIREKPVSSAQCKDYLASYSAGHPAETISGVMVTNTANEKSAKGYDVARQYFKPIPSDITNELIRKGDIMHCAGGFMIDDVLIQPYLDKREGTEDSIIGMPLNLLEKLLKEVE